MPILSPEALDNDYDVCVAGAGPAGLALALRCQERGLNTLVVEAGGERPAPGYPDILAADIAEPKWHDPVEIVSAAALGGTSHWWGGRSVPLDPVDFRDWPLSYEALAPWYEAAGAFFGAKGVHDTEPPGAFARLTAFHATRDETWCPQINMAKRWSASLREAAGPNVVLNARVTGIEARDGRVTAFAVGTGANERKVRARRFVLACGGLGALRLMLLAQRTRPDLFGGPQGPLGQGYMGHLTGTIADLAPSALEDADALAFRSIGESIYARRRITARSEAVLERGIPNIAFWIDNAYNENPSHGSSVASAKYVAARLARLMATLGRDQGEADLGPHLQNIARAPFSAATGLAHALYLLASARITGRLPRSRRFTPAAQGAWLMRYHAEQRPAAANRIRLSTQHADSIGLPKLEISFRFSREDCEAVVRAHELLDADLQAAGAGSLRWHAPREDCIEMVSGYARDGYHQLGGAPMSDDPSRGIVNPECRVHGIDNLWIASSCVFPSGGQANPTLTIVALALRIAEDLAKRPASAV